MIAAGKLDRRVTLLRPVQTRGPAGDVIVTYVPLRKIWAAVISRSGRDTQMSDQEFSAWDLRVLVRYTKDVKSTDKLLVSGERYDIAFIAEKGRFENLEILATKDLT